MNVQCDCNFQGCRPFNLDAKHIGMEMESNIHCCLVVSGKVYFKQLSCCMIQNHGTCNLLQELPFHCKAQNVRNYIKLCQNRFAATFTVISTTGYSTASKMTRTATCFMASLCSFMPTSLLRRFILTEKCVLKSVSMCALVRCSSYARAFIVTAM